jgi:site-specific recombinase
MLSYKNALILLISSALAVIAGAVIKIMQWSSISDVLLIVGAVGQIVAYAMALYIFFKQSKAEKH